MACAVQLSAHLCVLVVVHLLSCVQLFMIPWMAASQASLSFTTSQSLLKLKSIESMMSSNHLILYCPLLLLPPIFPSIRVFSSELVLAIRWSKYWNFSFNITPSNEHSGWFPLGLTGLISLLFKGLLRVLSSSTICKHQFFNAQPSLWSNSHICTWLLDKPWLWPYGPLLAKWCLCFLLCCLGWSNIFFQETMSFNFMASVPIWSDFGAPRNSLSLFPLLPYLFALKWWD